MSYRFHVTVDGRPDLSGVLDLEHSYREGDRFRLDDVPVRVTQRAEKGAVDQIDHAILTCVVIPEPTSPE